MQYPNVSSDHKIRVIESWGYAVELGTRMNGTVCIHIIKYTRTNGFMHKREALTRDEAIDQAYSGVHGFINSIVKYNEDGGDCLL